MLAVIDTHAGAAQTPLLILIAGPDSDTFWTTLACGVSAAASELGIGSEVLSPRAFDPAEQIVLLDNAVQRSPAAILIAPADRTAMIGPIRQAASTGIPILTVDTIIDEPIALAEIGSDNVLGGQMAVWALAELTGGSGTVYLSTTRPGISTTDQRQIGFEQALASYPGFSYLGAEFNQNDPALAAEQVISALQGQPDLTAIVATNQAGSLGAAEAVRSLGLQRQLAVIGFDAGPPLVDALPDGTVSALIAQHPYEIGYSATYTAADIVHSGSAPSQRQITTDYSVVTEGNIYDPIIQRILYVDNCADIPDLAATPTA